MQFEAICLLFLFASDFIQVFKRTCKIPWSGKGANGLRGFATMHSELSQAYTSLSCHPEPVTSSEGR